MSKKKIKCTECAGTGHKVLMGRVIPCLACKGKGTIEIRGKFVGEENPDNNS